MASVASQLIEEVSTHAQSDSLEHAREICADGSYFPNNLRNNRRRFDLQSLVLPTLTLQKFCNANCTFIQQQLYLKTETTGSPVTLVRNAKVSYVKICYT